MDNKPHLDLTGRKIGKLTVTGDYERRTQKNGRAYYYWRCICECGRETWVRGNQLTNGHTTSCGHHNGRSTHNMCYSRLYSIHHGMKQRCNNDRCDNYKHYGGRGIKVCEEWNGEKGFENFVSWALANGYSDTLTIDRKDVNGDYSPNNCRWITQKEQLLNKRDTVRTDNGIPVTNIASENNISAKTVRSRKRAYKWNDNALLDSIPTRRTVTIDGISYTLEELSDMSGISKATLNSRYNKGCADGEMLKPVGEINSIPIEQYDLNGNLVGRYKSIRDAAKATGVSMSGIGMCTSGHRKSCRGFVWKKATVETYERIERCLRKKPGGGWIDNRKKEMNKYE